MTLQICLLVSDDLDDHQAISEALSNIAENAILLNIIDSQRAVLLLQQSEYQPDRLILDLSMHGIKVNSILNVIRNNNNKIRLPVILYGPPESFSSIENREDVLFFSNDLQYSELKSLLEKVLL